MKHFEVMCISFGHKTLLRSILLLMLKLNVFRPGSQE
uniref:Uncharacterized protein n=1 Tax=Lepeophtheirus salmonis TaxID=72036 RepID=A0A0K2VIH3_LEPSM